MIKYIRVRDGYVEFQTNGVLEFYTVQPFATRWEALHDLCCTIFAVWRAEENYYTKDCCKKNPAVKFCPECGSPISTKCNWDGFRRYLADLHGSVADGTGDVWINLQAHGWDMCGEPFGITANEALVIDSMGSNVMFWALDGGLLAHDQENFDLYLSKECSPMDGMEAFKQKVNNNTLD